MGSWNISSKSVSGYNYSFWICIKEKGQCVIIEVNRKWSALKSEEIISKENKKINIFFLQGILTSETRCLNCETVSSKDEDFFDLQVDVDQNTSITHCLKCWSNTETLCSENKFKCDNCSSYQEAQKRMRVKKLPMILALHLKRFKYMEQYNRHIKVSHRVVFPLELRLFNTVRLLLSIIILQLLQTHVQNPKELLGVRKPYYHKSVHF